MWNGTKGGAIDIFAVIMELFNRLWSFSVGNCIVAGGATWGQIR